jgi:hypothetical protein
VKFGNGGKGGNANRLYFTAGISGGGAIEDHGLFGSIEVAFPMRIDSITATGSNLTLSWSGGVGPYLVQKKPSLSETNWLSVVTTTNQTVIVTKDGAAEFFRISDHATP